MVDWFMIDQTIAQIGFYLTTTSQFTLITLTLFFLRKNFGAYKYLILLFSGVGLAFASLEFMLYPILHYHKAGYIFFTTNRPLKASNELLVVLLAVFTGLYSTTISLLAVQYVYRYFAVFDKPRLKYFNRWYFIMWILYDTWFGFEGGVGIYKFNEADDYSREYMRREMRDVYGHDITDVPCMIHVVYEDISTNGSTIDYLIRWRCVICTINNAFIMMVQYGIMIYCGYRLYNDMEEKISMLSATMKKFHRQIFKTLFLQITTPTIVLFSPIAFIMTLPYFDLEISVPTGVFLSGLALYPALDAFILMYVVLHSHNAGYIFFPTNHLLNASNELLVVLLAVYTGIYSTTIALLAVQFIYRYFAVFDKPRFMYFNRWYFIMWLLYGTWFGFEWGIGFYKFNDYSREYMRQELRDIYGHDITDVPCMIHLVYEEIRNATTSDYLIRWSCVMCTINMTFIMMVQSQLQLISFSPIAFIMTLPYFDLETSVQTGFILSGLTLYPAIDAFILIVRNHIFWNKTYSADLQEKIDANKAQLPFSWMHDLSDHECSEKRLEDPELQINNLGCGTCMRGNGSISMMMLGNSYVLSLKNYIRDQFQYNYSNFHFCSIGGGNGFYVYSSASQRAINFYQKEVELHNPDVLFLLSRHSPPMKDPIEHNKRDIEKMNENLKYYEKFVKKIYILGAHPLYQHSFVDFFLQNLINRPEIPETLHMNRWAAENEMKIRSPDSQVFELTSAFLYGDKYLTFDEEESISYVDNTGHLTSAGLKLCNPILRNITQELMRTI
ncbi:hypothetical protein L5515_006519 [Caenorhabditis briggsae]|uniref:SGNH domain-containing protein n=1 Tax=Caenorhabditis briggsae TaxID=6238 RepID=A0AAE9JIX0_CAEBR|nr:hypothetical protein L5515_006519 [Caenorhabditis briggsae]